VSDYQYYEFAAVDRPPRKVTLIERLGRRAGL
jgi:hypothetical protein